MAATTAGHRNIGMRSTGRKLLRRYPALPARAAAQPARRGAPRGVTRIRPRCATPAGQVDNTETLVIATQAGGIFLNADNAVHREGSNRRRGNVSVRYRDKRQEHTQRPSAVEEHGERGMQHEAYADGGWSKRLRQSTAR